MVSSFSEDLVLDESVNSEIIGRKLRRLIKGEVLCDQLGLAMYSTDASIYQIRPAAVVLPVDAQDVAVVVEYARTAGLSVVPRGGGSGLAGEAVGPGIIVDMSRYMDRLLRIDSDRDEVTVQTGIVLEQLNSKLAAIGKKIGPDPSSGNQATIGGMIGNNATGAHSLRYGYVGGHLRRLRVVADDGQIVEISSTGGNDDGKAGQWAQSVGGLLKANCDLIERTRPGCRRDGSGYNVREVLRDGCVNLTELMAGSEGTLAIVTEATVGLVDLPKAKMLLQFGFDSLEAMALAVPRILELDPSACELMDGNLLAMARDAYRRYRDVLPESVAASLLVEFDGDDETKVLAELKNARRRLENLHGCCGIREIVDPELQIRVWAARNAAVPLLFRQKTAVQPIPIIEDVAVAPVQLAEYIRQLEQISRRLDITMAYYAHVGDGEMHTRPYLDLHDPNDVKKLQMLAEEVFDLVFSLGGTISGEHGEGLLRASFIEKQCGPEMYGMFRQIKQIFDPAGIFNPGKIINDDPDVLVKNLRFSHEPIDRADRNLIFGGDEFVREIEQCNGNGLCRSRDSLLAMCPIFRATGREEASPRAKANLMRHWLSGLLSENAIQTAEFKRIADLCVNCKMCALQCPSLVNIPKLMVEARAEFVKANGLTAAEFMLTRSEWLSRLGALFGPLANASLAMGWFRRMMELSVRLDHRRPFPRFCYGANLKRLRKYLAKTGPVAGPIDKVAYFLDLYANYNDHALGRAVVDILRHNRVEVILPDQRGASMPAISYGDLDYAKADIRYNLRHLAAAVRAGYKIVCSEPTAALCLKQEYADVVDSDDAKLVGQNSYELTEYLGGLYNDGKLRCDFRDVPLRLAYHQPCHYQALGHEDSSTELLGKIDGVQIEHLPAGCCGIAGTFGFQSKGFDLSMRAGEKMLKALTDSKSEYGLTECSTCKMQMEFGADKSVLHPAKILARAYGYIF